MNDVFPHEQVVVHMQDDITLRTGFSGGQVGKVATEKVGNVVVNVGGAGFVHLFRRFLDLDT